MIDSLRLNEKHPNAKYIMQLVDENNGFFVDTYNVNLNDNWWIVQYITCLYKKDGGYYLTHWISPITKYEED